MLKGVKVLEFQGLVPSIFCGMILADQGAEVIIAARKQPAPFSIPFQNNTMNRSKKSICVNITDKQDRRLLQNIISECNIIIDPFRPGVLQRLKLGPQEIFKLNPKAVILRVSGYGQQGERALKPGHDLNYLSVSGILPLINSNVSDKNYQFPANYLADFVSSSLGITATLAALRISKQTGIGRVVDCSLAQGCRYYTNLIMSNKQKKINKIINFIQYKNSEWCITSQQPINKLKDVSEKMIDKMISNNINYFSENNLQISKLTELETHQQQMKNLSNIFDNQHQNICNKVPYRNQNDIEYRNKYLTIKPKL